MTWVERNYLFSHFCLHFSSPVISPLLRLPPGSAALPPAHHHFPHHSSLRPGTGQAADPSETQWDTDKERQGESCWIIPVVDVVTAGIITHLIIRHDGGYLFGSRCPLTPGWGVTTATHGLWLPKSKRGIKKVEPMERGREVMNVSINDSSHCKCACIDVNSSHFVPFYIWS